MQEGLGTSEASVSSTSNDVDRNGNYAVTHAGSLAAHRDGRSHANPARDGQMRKAWPVERKLIEWVYDRVGRPRLAIVLWDGTTVGDAHSGVGQIIIQRPELLRRLFWNPNLAFGEGYSEGSLLIQGELLPLLLEINRGLERTRQTRQTVRTKRFTSRSHSFARSKSSVQHHYDIGNDFYRLWLDREMSYTCAYFASPAMTLEEAQVAKMDHVCRKLRLQPGETVVEAGCG